MTDVIPKLNTKQVLNIKINKKKLYVHCGSKGIRKRGHEKTANAQTVQNQTSNCNP